MIDISVYTWKLQMLKLWIEIEIDFSTACYDVMRLYEITGNLYPPRYDPRCSFEDFLNYTDLYYLSDTNVGDIL